MWCLIRYSGNRSQMNGHPKSITWWRVINHKWRTLITRFKLKLNRVNKNGNKKNSHEARLFADDCLLYRPICSRKDTEDLQQDLAALEDWEKQWQITFHPEKCVVIQISSKRSTISANYTLHNHQLDVVDSSKYLGVTINKNLRWDDHINNITARANRTDLLKQENEKIDSL